MEVLTKLAESNLRSAASQRKCLLIGETSIRCQRKIEGSCDSGELQGSKSGWHVA